MAASRSVILWDGTSWIPRSFWHALSSSLVAVSTSSVVTWHSVNWVIDFARRLTAASSIAVGRANKGSRGLHTGCSIVVERLRSPFTNGSIFLIGARAEWRRPFGSRIRWVRMLVWSSGKQRVPWLDVLWHHPTVQETNWDAQREKACVNTYAHASASQICLRNICGQ